MFFLAAMAFAIFEPIQVLPRLKLAPGFALVDQHGDRLTSEDGRGAVTIYSFAPLDCADACESTFATLRDISNSASVETAIDNVEVRIVTVSLHPVEAGTNRESLTQAAALSGADGETWRWAGGSAEEVKNVVGLGFGRHFNLDEPGRQQFDPGYVLVDGNGVIRGDYRYETLADDGDKLLRHLDLLGQELRNQDGPGALAYEAAHLFLCYP